MAKVHLETGLFGKAACGKTHVDTTRYPVEVTCQGCRNTALFPKVERDYNRERGWVEPR